MIKSLLIANRGEIACRIMSTARKMGVRTIAVYSDADAKAMHVREADEAVHIGPSPAAESYLVGDKIVAAAKETGAEAIHPGYGFLSENADFAQAVIDAGLIWVGPKPESIRAMGLKDAAKKLMDDAGVPTTPGYLGDNQDPDYLAEQADKIGYPVLIKAVAGGGGKGMRKVDTAEEFADGLLSCQREAKASFGNDIVLIEKWITSPRHIEVQVFGDSHGNVVHLFERDCSLQRRHQKVVEEAPAPGMDEATREELCAAAVRAAKAVDYEGAGTIEFIADASEGLRADRIWFMEMNTRLQVEHPVTEEITGVDLVEWQLRVASGEEIPLKQDELAISGHAVEVRLYAEDPSKGFLPSVGRLEPLMWPDEWNYPNLRIETGVETGDEVSPYYDPMVAKIISVSENRTEAINSLIDALSETLITPIKSNAGFLSKVLDHSSFRSANLSTGFITDNESTLLPPLLPSDEAIAAAATEVFGWTEGISYEPEEWRGFRMNSPKFDRICLLVDGEKCVVEPKASDRFHIVSFDCPPSVLLNENGQTYEVMHFRAAGKSGGSIADGAILSPMPGKVIALNVEAGDTVTAGQKLMVLEAMKMEHSIEAPFDGVVNEIGPGLNEQVANDALLVVVEVPE